MSTSNLQRVVNGFERGIYTEAEFFNLLTSRTSPQEVESAYELIPISSRQAFLTWVQEYNLSSPSVVLSDGDVCPSADTILGFRRLLEDRFRK